MGRGWEKMQKDLRATAFEINGVLRMNHQNNRLLSETHLC
ncbi:hypothetical protein MIDIC_230033 [Alphaproteobacteria bacterium]